MKQLEAFITKAKQLTRRLNVAVVWPEDLSSRKAIEMALEADFVDFTIVGCRDWAETLLERQKSAGAVSIAEARSSAEAAEIAVALVNGGKSHLIMKGLVNTDVLLKAILNKEHGLMEPGRVLTHISIADIPAYSKPLFFTDVAVLPFPNLQQRSAQINYLVDLCHKFDIACPKIALIHCSEKTDTRHFPVTGDYQEIIGRSRRGEFGECIIDGPLDLKTSCDLHAAQVKGISSPLNGEADALIFPDIESGNVFYKAMTLFAGATTAAIVYGARVPVIVPSRGDNEFVKYLSLAVATVAAANTD